MWRGKGDPCDALYAMLRPSLDAVSEEGGWSGGGSGEPGTPALAPPTGLRPAKAATTLHVQLQHGACRGACTARALALHTWAKAASSVGKPLTAPRPPVSNLLPACRRARQVPEPYRHAANAHLGIHPLHPPRRLLTALRSAAHARGGALWI